jgi:hypothetical protein
MNLLKKYAKKNGNNWTEMSKKTGIHRNSLMNISKYNHKQILNMTVGNILILQDKLGISMLEEFKEYHLPESAGE